MAATVAQDIDVRVTAVAEALSNQRVLDWFLAYRASLNIDVLIADKGGSTVRGLLSALKSGQLIALVADRDVTGTGTEVQFFGERTKLPAGPAALALRTNSVLLPAAVYFKEGRGHTVVIGPSIEPTGEGSRDDQVSDMSGRLATAFEGLIRRNPRQWHLVQPNWPSDHEFLATTAT
jgi:KDO2-lipid IV(A) lauroyltransferase